MPTFIDPQTKRSAVIDGTPTKIDSQNWRYRDKEGVTWLVEVRAKDGFNFDTVASGTWLRGAGNEPNKYQQDTHGLDDEIPQPGKGTMMVFGPGVVDCLEQIDQFSYHWRQAAKHSFPWLLVLLGMYIAGKKKGRRR